MANALLGRQNWAQYDASKAGLLGLTRDMAADHAEQDIRVNALLPGPAITDYHIENNDVSDVNAHRNEQTMSHEEGPGILSQWTHPRELANGVLFLASEEPSFVTGASIPIDSGLTAAGYDV
ncbi:SDR family NAD(P)-dependent oxidoreductase [Halomontanus rarus]|uniref:SDR family NAD(P)-dependent oxidoreductase n=1 Tax=Halomontanus rarus TaxID=3034020 RepID=UPI00293BCB2C|nr:SDR family oxidoreductase [Halovivax sp. KZCA124]